MFFQVWFSSSKGTTNGCKQGIYYSFRDTFPAPEKDSLLHVSRTFSFLLYSHGDNNGQEGGKRIEDGPPFNLNYASLITYGSFDPLWDFFLHLDYFFWTILDNNLIWKGKEKKEYVWFTYDYRKDHWLGLSVIV